jgi:hypothetical protein
MGTTLSIEYIINSMPKLTVACLDGSSSLNKGVWEYLAKTSMFNDF